MQTSAFKSVKPSVFVSLEEHLQSLDLIRLVEACYLSQASVNQSMRLSSYWLLFVLFCVFSRMKSYLEGMFCL